MFTVNRYLHNKQLVKKAPLYRLHFDDFRQGHRLTPRKTAEEKKNNELNFLSRVCLTKTETTQQPRTKTKTVTNTSN